MGGLRVLSLFAGIGGFDLGLERANAGGAAGFETVAFCEINRFCRRVLAKNWMGVPVYNDIRKLTAARLVDDGITPIAVVTGGFPCQPFSSAARGRNVAEDLWPEMLRIVREIGPRYVIAENVRERPIQRAADDLAAIGYRSVKRRIRASDIGADHSRERWWLCAYTDLHGEFHGALDAEVARMSSICGGIWSGANRPEALRILDGLPDRLDRVAALGNAVVPQIPEAIGRAILRTLARKEAA